MERIRCLSKRTMGEMRAGNDGVHMLLYSRRRSEGVAKNVMPNFWRACPIRDTRARPSSPKDVARDGEKKLRSDHSL